MLKLLKFLFLIIAIGHISTEHRLQFRTDEDFHRFYEKWVTSENQEVFRRTQDQFILQILNTTADPCDDFYKFACGNFRAILPEINQFREEVMPYLLISGTEYLKRRVVQKEVGPGDSETSVKVKTFYQSCMDESSWNIEEIGEFIRNFAAWPILRENPDDGGSFDWLNVTAFSARYNVYTMFALDVIDENGIYRTWFHNLYRGPMNIELVKRKAASLSINLDGKEEQLQQVANFVKKLGNLDTQYGLMGYKETYTLSELYDQLPEIDLRRYLQILRGTRRVTLSEVVILLKPILFEDLSMLISQTDPEIIGNYVLIEWILKTSILTTYIADPEKCLFWVESSMRPAYIRLFADNYFSNESYNLIKDMIDEMQVAGRKMISDSDWITPETKAKALEKINAVKKDIAYPDYIRNANSIKKDYKDLHVERNNFFRSFLSAVTLLTKLMQKKVGTIQNEFHRDPLEVGAYFESAHGANLIVTTGILQPPFFHKYSAQYVNYGSLGSIVGHEFMHGFDVQGILYDSKGYMGIWWDPRISSTLYTRSACYYSQYSKYKLEQLNMTVNSEMTIGENLADNEGLKLALNAYKEWLESNEEVPNVEVNGQKLTPIQLFFIAFAQTHCEIHDDENLQNTLLYDKHSPGFIRVLGTLSNSEDFAEAYNCPLGSGMNPIMKCKYLRK